jgi:hypothetical protein
MRRLHCHDVVCHGLWTSRTRTTDFIGQMIRDQNGSRSLGSRNRMMPNRYTFADSYILEELQARYRSADRGGRIRLLGVDT